MAFSFNPGQSPQGGAPNQGAAPLAGVQPVGAPSVDSLSSVPDSPFLFMRYRDQPMTVGAYLQILLMVVSFFAIATSIVVFSYSTYLSASIASKREAILAKDASFKEYPIEDMKRMSLRFSVLSRLLKEYISARVPLKFLEDVVEKQVVFNDFILGKSTTNSGHFMSFNVITNDYRTLIQQLDALNLTQYSKVVPEPRVGAISDTVSTLKINITAPVFIQGLLADDVIFIPPPATGTPQIAPVSPVTGSTTP